MKKWKILLIVMLTLTPLSVFATTYQRTREKPLVPEGVTITEKNIYAILQTPAVEVSEKIYDYANVLNTNEEIRLYNRISEYIKKTNIDLVIVTENAKEGLNIKDYANNFYRYNNFFKEGIIFVIYVGKTTDQLYLANQVVDNQSDIGSKVLKIYTNSYTEQILNRYVKNDIRNKKYYDAMCSLVHQLLRVHELEENGYDIDNPISEKRVWWIMIIVDILLTTTITAITIYIHKDSRRLVMQDYLTSKVNDKTLSIKSEIDDFIGSTQKRKN